MRLNQELSASDAFELRLDATVWRPYECLQRHFQFGHGDAKFSSIIADPEGDQIPAICQQE
jgi:hypothetical protein